jgi:hypothetical protein
MRLFKNKMRFGEHLLSHLTPEWISQYISYEELKEILYSLQKDGKNAEYQTSPDLNVFLKRCGDELDKINKFFIKKFEEAEIKFSILKEEFLADERTLKINDDKIELKRLGDNNETKIKKRKRKYINNFKLAISEFYLSLVLLQNYQSLNSIGFRKILKKYDKVFKTTQGDEWRTKNIIPSTLNTNKRVDELLVETENFVVEYLEDGNRERALELLQVQPLESRSNPWVQFRFRLFATISVLLSLFIILQVIFLRREDSLPFNWKTALKLYRGSLLIIIHVLLVGINIYIWRKTGINHVLIFEINPRNYLFYEEILELGTLLGLFWLLSVIFFIASAYFMTEYTFYPIILFLFLILYATNPLDLFKRSSRFWFLKLLWRSCLAPFYDVRFADFWFADQLCSFEFFFVDLQFIVCYYFAQVSWAPFKIDNQEPCTPSDYRDLSYVYNVLALILSCIPAWLRFLQCLRRYRDTKNKFPHLANALKYASYFFDVGALAIRYEYARYYQVEWKSLEVYTFLIIHFATSSYRIWWDLKMDWGFFDKNAGDNKFLREVCIYSSKWYYYFAIVQNIILRFIWIVRIYDISYLNTNKEVYRDVVATVLAFLEIYRRFVWNFFRLEYEHLNNCGQFRAVRDISIKRSKISDRENEEEAEKDLGPFDSIDISIKVSKTYKNRFKNIFKFKTETSKNDNRLGKMSFKNLVFNDST